MAMVGEHAVVLGAGISGLLAARALADFYRTVTVVERDELPDTPANRRGVPQGRHGHGLLRRGALILDDFLPGILDEVAAAGAPVWSDGDLAKIYFCFNGRTFTRSGTVTDRDGLGLLAASRPLLEFHLRRRVTAIPNVTVLAGHDFVDMTATADGIRVTGVHVTNRSGGEQRALTADLVVDAMGRGARTPAVLERLGYGRPAEDHIVTHMTYSTQLLQFPPATPRDFVVNIGYAAPGRPTGMALANYENDTAMFTAWGMVGQDPPRDLASMLAFVEAFAPDHVLAAMRTAEPLGEVARHGMPSSQWRRYDKMARFPEGLLVCGDAICSFNPIYGQGMTVAALDALTLRECLSRGGQESLSRRYFRAAAKHIAVPWQMGAGGDLAFPAVEGQRQPSMRLMNRFGGWVLVACESDAVVVERFLKVNHLVDPPIRLFHPYFLSRVAMANLRRRRRRQPVAAASTPAR